MKEWKFYGRHDELREINRLLTSERFFFCTISGRRRIGKTSLIREAIDRLPKDKEVFYVQIPDSDERGVVQAFEDAFEYTFDHIGKSEQKNLAKLFTKDFREIAHFIESMLKLGFIVIIDEFQYFHRQKLSEFTSHLQKIVDRAREGNLPGGLFVLGSIHTEMTAVLEDKISPLFNRITNRIEVKHWDIQTLSEMFADHKISDPCHKLFLWTLFEGVPKFYRDCFDHGVLIPDQNHRTTTLRKLFFEGSSPLRDEADNWFLRELRGRYDSVLKLIAKCGPCSYGNLKEEFSRTGPGGEKQLGGYLQILQDKYHMIEKRLPVFASPKARKSRYYIADNFLLSWLGALSKNIQAARIRPIEEAVEHASEALKTIEGYAFEKFVKQATEECSRKSVGDFPLTDLVSGYWNKPDGSDIEIDLVAINEEKKHLRLGSCKRSQSKHDKTALDKFELHASRFLNTKEGNKFLTWKIEKVLYATKFPSPNPNSKNIGYKRIAWDNFETWLQI